MRARDRGEVGVAGTGGAGAVGAGGASSGATAPGGAGPERWEPLPAAVPLAPGAVVPGLGGEVVLAPEPLVDGLDAGAAESVRSGLAQAGPLAVAGLVANGANAVMTVLLARLLTNRGYGSLAQLTGLFLVVSLPGSAVVVGVVRRVTAWRQSGEGGQVRAWAVRQYLRGAVAVAGFTVVVLVVRGWVADRLSSPDPTAVVAMLVAGSVWVMLSFDRGLVQAHRGYRVLAANLLLEGGARVVGILCLVGAGLGVAGAAGGVLVAEVVTAAHARWAADRACRPAVGSDRAVPHPRAAPPPGVAPSAVPGRRAAVLDLAVALPAMMLVALLQNVDVIVLARDAPQVSGSYAAISVASKAMVFAALVLGGYLLPEAAIRWHQGGHALRQLVVTLVLLAVPGALLLAAALGAPGRLLSVVFSARYTGAAHAFAPLVLAMLCLSVTVTLTMYLLAIGWRWVAGLLFLGSVAALAAVAAAHGSPVATARNDLLVQAGLAMVVAVGFGVAHRGRVGGH